MREKVTFSSKDSPRWGQPGFQWEEHINIGNFHRKKIITLGEYYKSFRRPSRKWVQIAKSCILPLPIDWSYFSQ